MGKRRDRLIAMSRVIVPALAVVVVLIGCMIVLLSARLLARVNIIQPNGVA